MSAASGATGGQVRLRPDGGFDAPTESEWARWWRIPLPARVYITLLVVCAVVLTASPWAWLDDGWGQVGTAGGLLIAGLINAELGRRAEGGRVDRQRIHKGLSAWPFAAALLTGPGAAGIVAAVLYTHVWVRGMRITRWKWIGSWAIVTFSGLAATATLRLMIAGPLPATGAGKTLAAVAVALVAFLLSETALLAVISRLNSADDEVYLRSQLASSSFYLVEASVLASGALVAVLYRYWPGFIALAAPAAFLMQRGILHQPLRHEARHDAKTGLLHSEAWRAAAGSGLTLAMRERRHAAVVMVDVDHFKAVNDTYGHVLGDEVLAEAAGAVVGSVRSTDIVGRFGGDEFCALVLCDGLGDAVATAERIRTRIRSLSFTDPTLTVTASIGAVLVNPDQPHIGLPSLIAAADQALYEAKTAGRDRICARMACADASSSTPPAAAAPISLDPIDRDHVG